LDNFKNQIEEDKQQKKKHAEVEQSKKFMEGIK